MPDSEATILALDVGTRRIGVAVASQTIRLARPLTTIANDEAVFERLKEILQQQHASVLVVGLPRGLDGQHTDQTRLIEDFVRQLRQHIDLPIYWQDEALTSRQAEAELQGRGKTYAKEAIDALAANYILEDFLKEQLAGPRDI